MTDSEIVDILHQHVEIDGIGQVRSYDFIAFARSILAAHAKPDPVEDGDVALVINASRAPLELDAENALVPHGLGGHGRNCLKTAIDLLELTEAARLAAVAHAANLEKCNSVMGAQLAAERERSEKLLIALTRILITSVGVYGEISHIAKTAINTYHSNQENGK